MSILVTSDWNMTEIIMMCCGERVNYHDGTNLAYFINSDEAVDLVGC